MPKELHATTGAQCGVQHEKLIRKIQFKTLERGRLVKGLSLRKSAESKLKGVATQRKEIKISIRVPSEREVWKLRESELERRDGDQSTVFHDAAPSRSHFGRGSSRF